MFDRDHRTKQSGGQFLEYMREFFEYLGDIFMIQYFQFIVKFRIATDKKQSPPNNSTTNRQIGFIIFSGFVLGKQETKLQMSQWTEIN